MDDNEAIEMMSRCSTEIKDQRRQIELLKPNAEAFEVLKSVVGLMPTTSQGYGEDIAWRLDKRIEELKRDQRKNGADAIKEED